MIKKYTFIQAAEEALMSLNTPSTCMEIWEEILRLKLDENIKSSGKTPWNTLSARLGVEIKNKNSKIECNKEMPPYRYFIKEKDVIKNKDQETEIKKNNEANNKYNYCERDLHPLLVYFAFHELNNTYCKTIYHEKSTKKSFNEWIHPDIVGFYFPFNYSNEVLKFTNKGLDLIKFYSFELKRELNFSNLRESFFQAVSNSSWAHEGYLVSANIKNDIGLRLELERLSNSFGIGVIELNVNEPEKTKIIFSAKTKVEIDWNAVEKLVQENPDFKKFMKEVEIDVSNSNLHRQNYDKLELLNDLKKKFV